MKSSASSQRVPAARALGVSAALFGAETCCLAAMSFGWGARALLFHVAICLAGNALAWRGSEAANAPVATLRMAAMLMPFLGPVAPLAAILLLSGQVARPRTPPNAAMWHEHLFPNLAADPINDRMDAITRRQPPTSTGDDVESFYDVLRWGTVPEREHVLSLISRSFRAEFAPVLREALTSDDLGLRAQAAAGLSLLETRTSSRIAALERSVGQADSETAREQASIALAQALASAAHSELYDDLRTIEMRREIVSLLAPLFDARGGDPALGVMLGRTMIHLGDLEGAVAALDRSIRSDGSAGQASDAAFGWLIEGLFQQGDFVGLTALLGDRREQAATLVARDGPLAPALSFWGTAA